MQLRPCQDPGVLHWSPSLEPGPFRRIRYRKNVPFQYRQRFNEHELLDKFKLRHGFTDDEPRIGFTCLLDPVLRNHKEWRTWRRTDSSLDAAVNDESKPCSHEAAATANQDVSVLQESRQTKKRGKTRKRWPHEKLSLR